jgi:cardiolipin synthase
VRRSGPLYGPTAVEHGLTELLPNARPLAVAGGFRIDSLRFEGSPAMSQFLHEFWPHITGAFVLVVELLAAGHAVLFKRDSRATIGWVGLILLTPLLGALLYWVFGINRIHRRAALRRSGQPQSEPSDSEHAVPIEQLKQSLGVEGRHFLRLVNLLEHVTKKQLLDGNEIEPLIDGDEAYPAMLAAIDAAKTSISLASYIFDNDRVGKMFAEALARALNRGVEIRVLIDDIGSHYTRPTIVSVLRAVGVRTETFMHSLMPAYVAYFNLRSHRKIMVVDGNLGFTGGMNIREGCWLKFNTKGITKDVHFRLRGPIVAHLQEVFAEDWAFTTQEVLAGDLWYPPLSAAGKMLARGIRYGPDEDLGKMRLGLIGALGVAQNSVSIVTPYFIPDDALIAALNVAAMRGVDVHLILPRKGNLRTVQWAMQATLWTVLQAGCRLWVTPPPFDHTKLMTMDGLWSLIGSGNWDSRSLRLNFEFNVEVYDQQFAQRIEQQIETMRSTATEIKLADVDARRLPVRLRDGVARLLSPYL